MKKDKTLERVLNAYRLKELRSICGLTQQMVCYRFKIEQGNYSRMERGMLNMPQDAKDFIISEFKKYRVNRIESLKRDIEYLTNLI